MKPIADRIMSKFVRDPATGCWPWTGALAKGYGRIGAGGRGAGVLQAHRVMYEMLKGPIPAGLDIDHLCRNRRCVNPDHMEPVTRRVNVLRGISPAMSRRRGDARSACPHGHPYTPDNTRRNAWGARYCLTCKREKSRARRRRAHG